MVVNFGQCKVSKYFPKNYLVSVLTFDMLLLFYFQSNMDLSDVQITNFCFYLHFTCHPSFFEKELYTISEYFAVAYYYSILAMDSTITQYKEDRGVMHTGRFIFYTWVYLWFTCCSCTLSLLFGPTPSLQYLLLYHHTAVLHSFSLAQ